MESKRSETFPFTTDDVEYLRKEWITLNMELLEIKDESFVLTQWEIFHKLYSETQRYYHNFFHLRALYRLFYKYKPLIQLTPAFLLAVWFHDAVYDPQSKDNEEQSSLAFLKYAALSSLPTGVTLSTNQMIKDTVLHKPSTALYETDEALQTCKFFLDADLAVLGQPPEEYKDFANRIWMEYSYIGREDYCKGRVKVLGQLKGKEQLFETAEFKKDFSEQAISNIDWEVAELTKELELVAQS